jgi:hypothetical protein
MRPGGQALMGAPVGKGAVVRAVPLARARTAVHAVLTLAALAVMAAAGGGQVSVPGAHCSWLRRYTSAACAADTGLVTSVMYPAPMPHQKHWQFGCRQPAALEPRRPPRLE